MKRLLLAPLILALSLPVKGGIPSKFEGSEGSSRWEQISKNFALNTEEVERRQDKLIFYVERRATKDEFEGPSQYISSYMGKITLKCTNFTVKIQGQKKDPLVGYYWSQGEIYEEIKPSDIAYDLASNFCFLTGVEGYTREANEPEWATKVIKLVQSQPIKKSNTANIDCDSPVYRNRPQCFDY